MASSYRTLNLDVLTVKTILVKDYNNSNIPINTILTSDGRGGTNWRNTDFILGSTRNDLRYGLSTVYSPYGISSLSSIMNYGLSSLIAGTINPGVSSLSSIVSYGLSTLIGGTINPGVSSLSSIISYGLSTVHSPDGISSLSSIVSYGLSTIASAQGPDGISSLSSIVSYGLSTIASAQAPDGISSLSSIVSYGLSSLEYAILQLGNADLLNTIEWGLSSLSVGTTNPGVSSLSSIISYGLSSLAFGATNLGVSSLSSIVSYGLSSFSFVSVPFNTVMYNDGVNIDFMNGPNNPSHNIINGLRVYSCAYGNNIWVASGLVSSNIPNGLVYSQNGINWNNVIFNGTLGMTVGNNDYVNNLKYIENNFVGISKVDNDYHIVWSSDGITWNFTANFSVSEILDYAYNASSNIWAFTRTINTIPSSSIIITNCNIFNSNFGTPNVANILSGGFAGTTGGTKIGGGKSISYNSNLWVAVGLNINSASSNVQFSVNGSNWTNASNITLRSLTNIFSNTTINGVQYGGTSIVYLNTTWYVAGARGPTSNPIYRSSNGRNYTAIATADTSNINVFYNLLYDSNYSRFYSLANISNIAGYSGNYLISSSNFCSNWSLVSQVTLLDQRQIGIASGIITPPLQTKSLFTNNIYSDTVNAAILTGDGNGITNLNVSVLSNSFIRNIITLSNTLGCNITTLSNSLSCNITRLSNTLSCNITILSNSLRTNITTLSNSLRTDITNVQTFFTATVANIQGNPYAVTHNKKTTTSNLLPGLLLSNIFSNAQLVLAGKYLVNIKFYLDTINGTGNWSNAKPYIYMAHCNESLEANNPADYDYLAFKAFYPINTSFRWHTLTDTITQNRPGPPLNIYNLYYSEQNNSVGSYNMNLYFTDIIVQRIA
jgi:hypothetical protein